MLLHAGKSPDETCFRWLEAEGPVLACDREVVTSLQVFNGKRLFPISSSSGVTFGMFFLAQTKKTPNCHVHMSFSDLFMTFGAGVCFGLT